MARARTLTLARGSRWRQLPRVLPFVLAGARAHAQLAIRQPVPPTTAALRPSVGLAGIVGAHPTALAQLGLETDAGLYARFGIVAGGGATSAHGGRAVGELAASARFLLDPLRQQARGLYATGGLALRAEQGTRPRVFVLAGLGLEGRPHGRVIPALEAGLGGGARLGIVLRPVRPGRR